MARSSRNRAGHLPVDTMGAAGAVVLTVLLAASQALAATTGAPSSSKVAAVKADSVKSATASHATKTAAVTAPAKPGAPVTKPTSVAATPATKPASAATKPGTVAAAPATKPASVAAAPSTKPATVATAPATKPASLAAAAMTKPQAANPVRRTLLVTLPSSLPTRATGMPHPEALRAVLIAKAAHPKTAPAKLAQAAGSQPASGSATNPRGAVTLTPANPGTVPMGIPAGDAKLAAEDKNVKGARVVAAAATGISSGSTLRSTLPAPANTPTVAGGGPQVSKMTVVSPGKLNQASEGGGKIVPTRAPTVGAGKSNMVPAPPALEDQVVYQYNALGRRDPFNSLLEGDFVGDDVGGDAPPDLGGLKVVGIVWGSQDQFAMVEDVKGNSFVLRRGDKVMNGYVEGLKQDAMIINITVDGQSQSVTVPITRKGDKSNANR